MQTLARSVLLLALILAADATAQATWTQVGANGQNRWDHALAYDSARQRVVMFGGVVSGVYTGDTWEWDGTVWVPVTTNPSPTARGSHAMVFDSARQRVVLFGGYDGSLRGDTWEWDGGTWVQRSPALSPMSRGGHAMAYDALRQRVVLFGGSNTVLLGDTWEWDGGTWLQVSPATSPSSRENHAMAYDSVRHRTVLFGGGGAGGTLLADTWEWNGTYWAAVFTFTYPASRTSHGMAFDASRQRVVLFGGSTQSAPHSGDTWEFNGSGWTTLPNYNIPSPRHSHAMAYDAARHRVVLFEGASSNGFGGTFINGLPPAIASATTFGTGCGQPPLGLVPDSGGRPVLGQTGTATIVDVPTSLTFVALGWSNQTYGPFALPVTLASIGMIGCDLWQSSDVIGLGTGALTPTTRSFALPLPNTQNLIGLHAYLQAYAFAPGANPLSIVISNAVDWQMGDI